MKVIIIEDKDARALLDLLKLESFRSIERNPHEWNTIQEVHRKFHYVVTTWLQDQGCNVVRGG